jgi:hypothetical protein
MRCLLYISFWFITLSCFGQKKEVKIDTVLVSFTRVSSILFESPILGYDCGTPDSSVYIQYVNRRVKILANIERFEPTNLIVETENAFYEYLLMYNSTTKKSFHVAELDDAVHVKNDPELAELVNKKEEDKAQAVEIKRLSVLDSVNNYFSEQSQKIARKNNSFVNVGILGKRMELSVAGIYTDDLYVYFKVTLTNRSNIRYDLEYMNFAIITKGKRKRRKSAEQETQLISVHVFNDQVNQLLRNESITRIYAFQKFTFDKNRELIIEAWEKDGNRNLKLSVDYKNLLGAQRID